ncbi:MAG: HNH endonuclease [Betaproteobacteria bacterium]|nr:HNH endonuclease [Betaproteobacteria bacterium]
MKEIWKPVPGYTSRCYEVSNLGRVRSYGSRQKEKVMRPVSGGYKGKYLMVRFWDKGKVAGREYVHRLVATIFLGEPPTEKHQVNHKDFNTHNNAATNLEWVTQAENSKHASPRMSRKGVYNPRHKLTPTDILAILNLAKSGVSAAEIGRRFSVSAPTIFYHLRNGGAEAPPK